VRRDGLPLTDGVREEENSEKIKNHPGPGVLLAVRLEKGEKKSR